VALGALLQAGAAFCADPIVKRAHACVPRPGPAAQPGHPAPSQPPITPLIPTPSVLQERLHVVWQELVNSGQISPSDFVRVTSTAAAQIFNIYPRKGVVSGGGQGPCLFVRLVERFARGAWAVYPRMPQGVVSWGLSGGSSSIQTAYRPHLTLPPATPPRAFPSGDRGQRC